MNKWILVIIFKVEKEARRNFLEKERQRSRSIVPKILVIPSNSAGRRTEEGMAEADKTASFVLSHGWGAKRRGNMGVNEYSLRNSWEGECLLELDFILSIGNKSMKLRKWTAEEKMSIVLEGLKGKKSVARTVGNNRSVKIYLTVAWPFKDKKLVHSDVRLEIISSQNGTRAGWKIYRDLSRGLKFIKFSVNSNAGYLRTCFLFT